MTVTTTRNIINQDADGVATEFAYDFIIPDAENGKIYFDGTEQTAGFTFTGLGNPAGGTVIFDTPPPAGTTISILRVMPENQLVDYQPYDPFPANTHEAALDKLTMIDQQQQEQINRAYKAPVGSEPDFDFQFPPWESGKLIAWHETVKNILVNSPYGLEDIVAEADRAEAEANRAQSEANRASGEANTAAGHADKAQQWANEDEDVPVEGDLYSAKHWAIKASQALRGMNLLGPIDASDTCPKLGDDPGDCTDPDYRNPSQRWPTVQFVTGDAFFVNVAGNMELIDPNNPPNTYIQALSVVDYIVYFEEIRDGNNNIIIHEGWYWGEGAGGGDTLPASNVSFDDTGTTIKGPTVQAWNEAADAELARKDGATFTGQVVVDHNLVVRAQDNSNNRLWFRAISDSKLLAQVYANPGNRYFVIQTQAADGSSVETVVQLSPTAISLSNPNGQLSITNRSSSGSARFDLNPSLTGAGYRVSLRADGGNLYIDLYDDTGALAHTLTWGADGNLLVSGNRVFQAQDMLRTGDRLDIYNVRTS